MDGLLEMENKNVSENTASQLTFKPWRVFINHVDSYHGKKLTDFLLAQSYSHPLNSMSLNENNLIHQGVVNNIQEVDSTFTTTPKTSTKMMEELETTNYEITGTVINNEHQVPKSVRIIKVDDREVLLHELMSCGFVIFDITLHDDQIEQARWSVKAIARELENLSKSNGTLSDDNTTDARFFMLISNIMTWAQTKSLDPENPYAPFTEADYAKRIAHENFMQHMHCENDVLMIKKHYNVSLNFKTLVLCCGITYGDEQGPLSFLFKMASNNSKSLAIFGDGTNKIPLLRVTQFVTIVHSLLLCWPGQMQYLVATELDLISQATIVKKISAAFSSGEIKQLEMNESNEFIDISPRDYNIITVNVNIEPAYTLDKFMQSNVTFEMDFNNVIREYRTFHNLLPVKIIVIGPPAVGKTTLSKRLADYYCNSYVDEKSLITQTIQSLTLSIERIPHVGIVEVYLNNIGSDEIDDKLSGLDLESCVTKRVQLLGQLNDIRNNLMENNGRLDDHVLNKIIFKHLTSKECLHKGYVMDDYPKTSIQAGELFGGSTAMNNMKNDDIKWAINNSELLNIMPQLVVALEASDELLLERVIHLPERETQRANHNVGSMLRRLREYRKHNADDNMKVENFFDMNDVPILILPIAEDCPQMHSTFRKCVETIGRPQNSGLKRLKVTSSIDMMTHDGIQPFTVLPRSHNRRVEEISVDQRKKDESLLDWTYHLEKILQDEENNLQQLSEPLRLYLVIYIFPTLTQGLIEMARIRPDDPVDFLMRKLSLWKQSVIIRVGCERQRIQRWNTRLCDILVGYLKEMAYNEDRSLPCSSTLSEGRIIIDIVGFRDNDGDLIPKEIAIASLDHDFIEHHIVSPPCWFYCLKKEQRENCKWQELRHGLGWLMKGISIEQLQQRLKQLMRLSSKVYTFGSVVTRSVRELTHVAPTDVIRGERDITGLPLSDRYCLYHGMEWKGNAICALNNVSRIKAWLHSPRGKDYNISKTEPIYVMMKPLNTVRPTYSDQGKRQSECSTKSATQGTSKKNS